MIRVLIVEDDPMVAEMNRFYLEQVEGFGCMGWASSPDEALKLLESEEIDLVLLDLYMKAESGLALLAEIRRRGRPLDVIVISAASDKSSIQQALQNGVVDYLIKPFEFARFRDALDGYRERNRILRGRSNLDQAQLDALTRPNASTLNEGGVRGATLPKGCTKPTLRLVWKAVEAAPEAAFSAEEIANAAGLSRVSAGKYLTVLHELNVLEMEAEYGGMGRPVQRYRILPDGRSLIAAYL